MIDKKIKVIITVGSGGAFKSGSADLTAKAKKIMAKIAEVNKKGRSEILVSGHTDNKPSLLVRFTETIGI